MELKSPSTKEPCTESQYLAEIMVTRLANSKKRSLPYKFWNTDEWKKVFKSEILAACSLLKLFKFEVILDSLNSKEANWVYTLRYAKLVDIIKSEETRQEMANRVSEYSKPLEYNQENTTLIPKQQKKSNYLDRLREIDGKG